MGMWIYFWVFDTIPKFNLLVFILYQAAFVTIRNGDTSGSSFVSQIVLVSLGFLFFYIKLSIVHSSSVKNHVVSFMGIALNL